MEEMKWKIDLTPEQLQDRKTTAEALLKTELVQDFLKKHNLNQQIVYDYAYRFQQWVQSYTRCDHCGSLSECRQPKQGEYFSLQYQEPLLNLEIAQCRYKRNQEKELEHLSYFKLSDMPNQLAGVSLAKIDIEQEEAGYTKAVSQIGAWLSDPQSKGLYLVGNPGVGKTYLAACAANYFAKQKKTVCFVNVPSLAGRLKGYFDDPEELEYQLSLLRRCDFVVFDDIGAESVTSWIRDEVLLSVLNARMDGQKWTWFTSNDDWTSLENHFLYNQKQEKEEMKALRIMERIKALSKVVKIVSKNRRNDDN